MTKDYELYLRELAEKWLFLVLSMYIPDCLHNYKCEGKQNNRTIYTLSPLLYPKWSLCGSYSQDLLIIISYMLN